MKTRFQSLTIRGSALLAALALIPMASARAQDAAAIGGSRSANERIATETAPQINADPSRPELRSSPRNPALQGLDRAILIEHAVDMAIEGSSMLAIAGPASPNATEADPIKNLRNKARKMMVEGQTLLGQAAADGSALAANPPVGRFHSAANLYVTTLAGMDFGMPGDLAQVAMINQAVKDVLDADHIQQMSGMNKASVPLQQLKAHAALMKAQGTDLIRRMTAESVSDTSIPVNVSALAMRGKKLLEAADEMGRSMAVNAAQLPTGNVGSGQFSSNRPEILGGTYGTGSARLGVYQGLDHPTGANAPKAMDEPSTIPTYSGQTTGSTGGLRPH